MSVTTSSGLGQLQTALREFVLAMPKRRIFGVLHTIATDHIKVKGLSDFAHVGDTLEISTSSGIAVAEIERIDKMHVYAILLNGHSALQIGMRVELIGRIAIRPSLSWRGRVLDATCKCIDSGDPLVPGDAAFSLDGVRLTPLERSRTGARIATGVRAIDMFMPICIGQRIGIFAGSGVGKSTLLGMLAGNPQFDAIVVALIGERMREVREFIEDTLADRLSSAVVVVSTSGDPASLRRRAARSATTIAEYYRDCGMSVCLLIDSVTRLAHAERDIAMASGEAPVARGYPPSVLGTIAALLERSGPGRNPGGSITAFYTVLVDGDDHNEPLSDHVRGILDGHIVLSREIAERGRFPAIDTSRSVSRLAGSLWSESERERVKLLRDWISIFEETRDLRAIGGYAPGTNLQLDRAVTTVPLLYEFLAQGGSANSAIDPFEHFSQKIANRIGEAPPKS